MLVPALCWDLHTRKREREREREKRKEEREKEKGEKIEKEGEKKERGNIRNHEEQEIRIISQGNLINFSISFMFFLV